MSAPRFAFTPKSCSTRAAAALAAGVVVAHLARGEGVGRGAQH